MDFELWFHARSFSENILLCVKDLVDIEVDMIGPNRISQIFRPLPCFRGGLRGHAHVDGTARARMSMTIFCNECSDEGRFSISDILEYILSQVLGTFRQPALFLIGSSNPLDITDNLCVTISDG